MSAEGDELFLDLHKSSVEILAQNPNANILALMDKVALAGFQRGADHVTSTLQAQLHVMLAQISAGNETRDSEKRQA